MQNQLHILSTHVCSIISNYLSITTPNTTGTVLRNQLRYIYACNSKTQTARNCSPTNVVSNNIFEFFPLPFSFPPRMHHYIMLKVHYTYLHFLIDLDFFILLDFLSTLVHVYPLGIANGSESIAIAALF